MPAETNGVRTRQHRKSDEDGEPKSSAIRTTLGSSPRRERREAVVEVEPRSAALLAADIPGVRRIDLGSGGRACAALDVKLNDAETDVE